MRGIAAPHCARAAEAVRECIVCFYPDGEVYGSDVVGFEGERVVVPESRCTHDVCMRCFEELRRNDKWSCQACKRPAILNPMYIEGDHTQAEWVSKVGEIPGVAIAPAVNKVVVYQHMREILPSLTELDSVEVTGIIMDEFRSRGESILNLLEEEGDGELVPPSAGDLHERCEIRNRGAVFQDKLERIIRSVAQIVCRDISTRWVMKEGERCSLVAREDLSLIYSRVRQGLECFIDKLANRHMCRMDRMNGPPEAMLAVIALLSTLSTDAIDRIVRAAESQVQ